MTLNHSILLQLVSCTIGCIGVCFWYNGKGKQLFFTAVGAFLTWGVEVLAHSLTDSNFMSTFLAAVFVAFYAELMARVCRAPSTIFLTAGAFPLVPGASLYSSMHNAVLGEFMPAAYNLFQVIAVAMAIALGFIVVSILRRYVTFAVKYHKHKQRLRAQRKS